MAVSFGHQFSVLCSASTVGPSVWRSNLGLIPRTKRWTAGSVPGFGEKIPPLDFLSGGFYYSDSVVLRFVSSVSAVWPLHSNLFFLCPCVLTYPLRLTLCFGHLYFFFSPYSFMQEKDTLESNCKLNKILKSLSLFCFHCLNHFIMIALPAQCLLLLV